MSVQYVLGLGKATKARPAELVTSELGHSPNLVARVFVRIVGTYNSSYLVLYVQEDAANLLRMSFAYRYRYLVQYRSLGTVRVLTVPVVHYHRFVYWAYVLKQPSQDWDLSRASELGHCT
jgi:hypothetical protein